MNRLDMPIEQLVRRAETRFQLGFAVEASRRVPAREDFALVASRDGLRVLARNEDSLGPPVTALRDEYGGALVVQPPAPRLIEGPQVQEPIMHVRISLRVRDLAAVARALRERRAIPEEEYAKQRLAVLRYVAPLARLIGLPAQLAEITGGTAQHWIVLSHYALVTGGPGGRAA